MCRATYPELLVGLDEKVELGRALWWRLLCKLVIDSYGRVVSSPVGILHAITTAHLCL
jgi:hypothetical protein